MASFGKGASNAASSSRRSLPSVASGKSNKMNKSPQTYKVTASQPVAQEATGEPTLARAGLFPEGPGDKHQDAQGVEVDLEPLPGDARPGNPGRHLRDTLEVDEPKEPFEANARKGPRNRRAWPPRSSV